jgi:hypothetical protein
MHSSSTKTINLDLYLNIRQEIGVSTGRLIP